MNRLFSGILASAMALAVVFASQAAFAKGTHSSMSTMHSSKVTKHSCPTGEHWVKGYVRNGKKVHGYCRK